MMDIRSLKASGYGYRPYQGYDQWGCYYNDYKAAKKTKTIILNYDEDLVIDRSYIDFNEIYLLPDDQISDCPRRRYSGIDNINKNIGITRKLVVTPKNWYLFKYRKVKRKEYYQNGRVAIVENGGKGLTTIRKFKSYLTEQERNEKRSDIHERLDYLLKSADDPVAVDDGKIRQRFESAWKLYSTNKERPTLNEFSELCKHEKWYNRYLLIEECLTVQEKGVGDLPRHTLLKVFLNLGSLAGIEKARIEEENIRKSFRKAWVSYNRSVHPATTAKFRELHKHKKEWIKYILIEEDNDEEEIFF